MSAMLLALALAAPAVQAADENPWKFEFHGLVSASMYYQDQVFANGQGQGLLFSAPAPSNLAPCKASGAFNCTATATFFPATKSATLMSGDIRNSRFSFAMSGPKVFGDAQPRAYFEFDLFGPNGGGAFGTEQNLPRIRAAIAEVKFGNTTVQVGQQNQLVVQQIIGSLSHLSNPVSYGAGTIAWRTPGIRVSHAIPLDNLKLTLAAEVVKNKWSNESINQLAGPGAYGVSPATQVAANSTPTIGLGEAGTPMVQALARIDGTAGAVKFVGYLVGAYHQLDLNGFGDGLAIPGWAAGKKSVAGNVVEVGGNVTFAPVNFAFNFYTGKTTGNMLGSLLYFGDIKDTGYWAQLAGNFTKELSLSLAYGACTPDKADIRRVAGAAGVRLANAVMGGMLKYQDGSYAVGVEAWQNTTAWADTATTQLNTTALQVIGTVNYSF
jgi:hypothetical protein